MSARQWTTDQKTAIEHVGGDLLVSAAAGSGKTATLAERCARLINEEKCNVDSLLVLTFTEAAANEMRSRIAEAISALVPDDAAALSPSARRRIERQAAMVERAAISTLHSFCARVLRQYFHDADIDPSFELIDQEEAALLRDDILQSVLARWHAGAKRNEAFATDFAAFYESYAQGRDSTLASQIERVYSMLASTENSEQWKAQARARFTAAGIEDSLNHLAAEVLPKRLAELLAQVDRSLQKLAKHDITGPIIFNLELMHTLLERIRTHLQTKKFAGWDELPTLWQDDPKMWQRISSKDMGDDFAALKDSTWEKCKKTYRALRIAFYVADASTLRKNLAVLAPHIETLLALVDDFEKTFAQAKREQNRLDFNDLERFALKLLTAENSQARTELRRRFDHILVDEFQDINPLQAALLHAVRSDEKFGGTGNLFVVGDMKQSIYGFRLAEPKLFRAREEDARNRPDAYVALAANFRSQPKLLSIMNHLFERMLTPEVADIDYPNGHALQPPPVPRPLPSDPAILTGEPVELLLVTTREADDAAGENAEPASESAEETDADEPRENLSGTEAEARMVAKRIAALIQEGRKIVERDGASRNLRYRDCAILLRGMANRALLFARALAAEGIPVHADLSSGYFDAPEVRQTLSLLQVLDNPQQDIPLASTLAGPFGRLSFDDLARIRLAYDRKQFSFHAAALAYAEESRPENPEIHAKLRAIFERLNRWRTFTRTRPLHEALGEIYSESKIIPYVSGLEAGMQRVANLQMLHQRALQFSTFRKQGLHRFLRFIEKIRDREADFGEAPILSEASDVVRIMSVHKSKGLEFPVVFLCGTGSRFNLGRDDEGGISVHRDLHLAPKTIDVDRNVHYHSAASIAVRELRRRTDRAEELRLLYVAITRARDHLIITGQAPTTASILRQRDAWAGHTGGLPEDMLLGAWTFLDWLLPAIAASPLRVQWPDESVANPHFTIHIHSVNDLVHPRAAAATPDDSEITRLLQAAPLPQPSAPAAQQVSDALAMRLQKPYPFHAYTTQPAVVTVSELKSQLQAGDPDEPVLAAIEARPPGATLTGAQARARGIATHRIMELFDFAAWSAGRDLEAQITRMILANAITADDAARVDRPAILWFLQTELAARIASAALRKNNTELRREIPFTWISPRVGPDVQQRSDDPRDWPTVRGVIDALLIDHAHRTAEIVDYKTDAPWLWKSRLPEYQRQMNYYLWAAGDILGFAPTHASLVFLAPHEIHRVDSRKPE